jgi:transporter family protein
MSWLFFALLAPAINTVVNFTDKYILEKELKDYRIVPLYTAVTAFIAGTLFWLFTGRQLLTPFNGMLVLSTGAITLWSLVIYFKALSQEETSKIVLLFKMTPLITLLFSFLFLKEYITIQQFIGFILILAAVLNISRKKGTKLIEFSSAFWLILLYDVMLAATIILIKFAINLNSFTKVLSYESWGISIGGVILYLVAPKIRRAFHKSLKTLHPRTIAVLFFNETVFVIGKVVQFIAFSLGSAVLVNVVGTTEVFYGILYGWILTIISPKVFKEDIGKEGLLRKAFSALVLFIGVWLIY